MRHKFQAVNRADIENIDAALAFVGGSRAAAAKLLSMTTCRLKYLIRQHDKLARWRRSSSSWSPNPGFEIEPVESDWVTVGDLQRATRHLSLDDRVELCTWLQSELAETRARLERAGLLFPQPRPAMAHGIAETADTL